MRFHHERHALKILLTGATGFIGRHILETLLRHGHEVTAAVRHPEKMATTAVPCDFAKDVTPEDWVERVRGFDVVINTVGIIAQRPGADFETLHHQTPAALFRACEQAGVRRIIQISALGADDAAATPYHLSKKAADDVLRSLRLEYLILKPSIVYGEGGVSTALFRALAALPLIPVIGDGRQQLQPIHIDDVANAVAMAVETPDINREIDLVGPRSLGYAEMLSLFRRRLGLKKTATFRVPEWLAIFGTLLDEPAVSRDNIAMLKQGNTADAAHVSALLGRPPKEFASTLLAHPAENAEKLQAKLYFIAPLLRIVIGLVWIWSGIVSAFLFPRPAALQLLSDVGISGSLAVPTLYVASFLDIAIGVLTLTGYHLVRLARLQILVITVYTLILTLLAPYHWLHPFGPVLKNLPLVIAIYVMIVVTEHRR